MSRWVVFTRQKVTLPWHMVETRPWIKILSLIFSPLFEASEQRLCKIDYKKCICRPLYNGHEILLKCTQRTRRLFLFGSQPQCRFPLRNGWHLLSILSTLPKWTFLILVREEAWIKGVAQYSRFILLFSAEERIPGGGQFHFHIYPLVFRKRKNTRGWPLSLSHLSSCFPQKKEYQGVATSKLVYKPDINDDGRYLACRVLPTSKTGKSLEDTWEIKVLCE